MTGLPCSKGRGFQKKKVMFDKEEFLLIMNELKESLKDCVLTLNNLYNSKTPY